MAFLVIDIETTGLNEKVCQVLEVACIVGDYSTPIDELPVKRWRIMWDVIIGEPFALAMNKQLIEDMITKPEMVDGHLTNYIRWDEFGPALRDWMKTVPVPAKPFLAGKNVARFDIRFLQGARGWVDTHHRTIDPGMYYFWPDREDGPPDTKECIRRSGLIWDTSRLHSAIDDCKLVLELLRRGYTHV